MTLDCFRRRSQPANAVASSTFRGAELECGRTNQSGCYLILSEVCSFSAGSDVLFNHQMGLPFLAGHGCGRLSSDEMMFQYPKRLAIDGGDGVLTPNTMNQDADLS